MSHQRRAPGEAGSVPRAGVLSAAEKSLNSSLASLRNRSSELSRKSSRFRSLSDKKKEDFYQNDFHLSKLRKMQQTMKAQIPGLTFGPLGVDGKSPQGQQPSRNEAVSKAPEAQPSQHSEQVSYISDDKKAEQLTQDILQLNQGNATKFHARIRELTKKA